MPEPTNESSTERPPPSPLEPLRLALGAVLRGGFDEALRDLLQHEPWFRSAIPLEELFSLWVRDRIARSQSSSWVFELIRPSERRLLADELGVDRSQIVGLGTEEFAQVVVAAAGLPKCQLHDAGFFVEQFDDLILAVENDDDLRAATLARQRAERVLRVLAYFYAMAEPCRPAFDDILASPGELRLPKRLTGIASAAALAAAISEDGWADLGFLSLLLRKAASRCERLGVTFPLGQALTLLTSGEHETFTELASALQAYAHDRPSAERDRQARLRGALVAVRDAVAAMHKRGALPREVLVLECCMSILGPTFTTRTADGSQVSFTAAATPPVGAKLLVVQGVSRAYANCAWVVAPW